MKTLKQIIAEAKDKRPYPTTKHGDALHKDHDYDEDKLPPEKDTRKKPKEGKRVLLVPKNKVKDTPMGKPVIGWKNKK